VDRVLIHPEAGAGVGDPRFNAKVTCIIEHGGINQFEIQQKLRGTIPNKSFYSFQPHVNFFVIIWISQVLNMGHITAAPIIHISRHR
jgi:hypothetical protein